VVQALGSEKAGKIGVQAGSTPAWLGFAITTGVHLLGCAVITPGRRSRPRGASRARGTSAAVDQSWE
jgi:hypothetical protein